MASIAMATVRPARRVRGRLRPVRDKSISHRYALLAALAKGRSKIRHYSTGADCAATLDCLVHLGVSFARLETAGDSESPSIDVEIDGRGARGLLQPGQSLDARNSGTTMRLLSGVLAAHPFSATLTGDGSLSRRPMRRIIEPLERMGARITSDNDRPPLTVTGADLAGIEYTLPVPSAQVKSAVLLAGLQASGRTRVIEPAATRNHTELGLAAFGAHVAVNRLEVTIEGGQPLSARTLSVPGDL